MALMASDSVSIGTFVTIVHSIDLALIFDFDGALRIQALTEVNFVAFSDVRLVTGTFNDTSHQRSPTLPSFEDFSPLPMIFIVVLALIFCDLTASNRWVSVAFSRSITERLDLARTKNLSPRLIARSKNSKISDSLSQT